MTETITHPDHPGYTITIRHVDGPYCPLLFCDTYPPLLIFNDGSIDGYADGSKNDRAITVYDILAAIPISRFGRAGNRREICEILFDEAEPLDLRHYLPTGRKEPEHWRDAISEVWRDTGYDKPVGWRSARAYFECLAALCRIAGITCVHKQIQGYVQGSESQVFAATMPDWVEKVGAPKPGHVLDCQYVIDDYRAWAYGDVWEIESITDPAGDEVEREYRGEYCGDDHQRSGLLEEAGDLIDSHKTYLAKESAAALDAACRDIPTDPASAGLSRVFPTWSSLATA